MPENKELINTEIPQSVHHEDREHLLSPLTTLEAAGFAAWAVQCFANGIMRQTFSNIKQVADFRSSENYREILEIVKKDPKEILTSNMGKRLLYQATGIYPALWVRDSLTKNQASELTISFGVSATETLMRSVVEAYSGKTMIKKEFNIDASQKQVFQMGYRALVPFFFRNYFSWLVINNESENVTEKITKGGISGIISTPFETLGNAVMRHSLNSENIFTTYQKAWQDLTKGDKTLLENLGKNLFRGSLMRSSAGIGSVILLSPDCSKFLSEDLIIPLAKKFGEVSKRFESKNSAIQDAIIFDVPPSPNLKDNPSVCPQNPLAESHEERIRQFTHF